SGTAPAWVYGSSRPSARCGSIWGTTWTSSRGGSSSRSTSRSGRRSSQEIHRGDAMRNTWTVGLVTVAFMLLLGGNVARSDAAGTRIGYVDVQRVIVRSVAGVAAREQLEKDKVAMQKDVDNRK